jgi:2'-5' RNA ligase
MQLQAVTTTTIPGYRVSEYLLVLEPHEELGGRLIKVKKEFSGKYKTASAAGRKPWLPLVNFLQYEMMEDRIMNRLRIVAMGFPAFKVELKDFGSFPSHTIYINVTSKIPVQKLVKEIRHETQRLMKLNDDNKPHFILEPHITIAAKLLPWQYEKGWLEYSQRYFTGRFIAYGMLLLKKPAGEKIWQVKERFEFQNMPVATRQGALFF